MVVYIDHSAVKIVLEAPNPSAKHARRWTKVYGSGVESIQIVSRSDRENGNADTLSRNPQGEVPCSQVAMVNTSEVEIRELLNSSVPQCADQIIDFGTEHQKDEELRDTAQFLRDGSLPDEKAAKISCQSLCFAIVDGILYFKQDHCKGCAVPHHLRNQI